MPIMSTLCTTSHRALLAALFALPLAGLSPALADQRFDVGDLSVHCFDEKGVPHVTIERGNTTLTDARPMTYEIELVHGTFDPLANNLPLVPERFTADPEAELHIVQFVTQPMEAYRQTIIDLGGRVSWYLPQHAQLVRMNAEVRAQVEALPFVRWVGSYHPAWRLEPAVLATAMQSDDALPAMRYNVMLLDADQDVRRQVADRMLALGAVVDKVNAGKYLMEVTLDGGQLQSVLRFDEVLYIDRWGAMEPDMDIVRQISGANTIEALGGFTGAGIRGEVLDIGFNVSHVDFASRPLVLHGPVSTDSHGASTSGIIFGDGTGQANKRGLLPDAQGIVADTATAFTGTARYDHTGELVQSPYLALFQSSSVGSPQTTQYTTISADIDAMLFDFDIVHAQSQSNTGNQNSRPQAWAKNIISVGAVRHHGTLTRADDCWNCGSTAASHGPAADGRIKPDLCHFYDDTGTVTSGSPTAYTESFGGTSGATPIVSGHVGLFFDMWADGAFGNSVDPGASDFDNRCHMTTAKAAMINHASPYDWNQGGANADIDRFRQGWGLPDVASLYAERDRIFFVDESVLLTNMATTQFEVEVLPGEPDLRITMVYADPPGVPGAAVHRVNDLTLRVLTPSGVSYWGNHGLTDGNWSTPNGAPDTLNTVENVFIENPEPGTWTIAITAMEVNVDGVPETLGLDADFALWVSGVSFSIRMVLLDATPDLVAPGTPVEIDVDIVEGSEAIEPGSTLLHYRFDGGSYLTTPLVAQGGTTYRGTIPGAMCDSTPEFYLSVLGSGGTEVTIPGTAPAEVLTYEIGEILLVHSDDFEVDAGWTVDNTEITGGAWERGVPAGAGDRGDPLSDFDGSGACWLTENLEGNSDVDGGPTTLTSTIFDLSAVAEPVLHYAHWFSNDDLDGDRMVVSLSANGGADWSVVESIAHHSGWQESEIVISEHVAVTNQFRVRFSVTDNPNNSVTEAGLDALRIDTRLCDGGVIPGDVDGDGVVGFSDLVALLAAWGACPPDPDPCPADFDGNGTVDFADLLSLLANWS